MTVRDRFRGALATAGALIRRGTRRGAHEAQVRRLQWEIDRHKATIGRVIYPLLETGNLTVDIPEVNEQLARIRELHQRLREVEAKRHAERSSENG